MGYVIFIFSLSLLLTIYADHINSKNNKKKIKIALTISALLISILAGIRADHVGTDVLVYTAPLFYRANTYSNLFEFFNTSSIEVGYVVLVFIISRFTKELGWVLFFTQLLTILPIYIGIYKIRNKGSFFVTNCIYLFWFYCYSLDIMRQSIACAMLLCAVIYYEERDKKFILFMLLGFVFHYSSLFGIFLYIVVKFSDQKRKNSRLITEVIILVGTCILLLSFSSVLQLLSNISIINSLYYKKMNNIIEVQNIPTLEFILRFIILFTPALFLKLCRKKYKEYRKWNYMSFITYIISFGRVLSPFITRLVYYGNYYYIIGASQIPSHLTKNNRKIYNLVIFIICLIYWYMIYVQMKWHTVFPYDLRF